jgi:serine phosphatase RsbU (regulator of sigma subunit)
VLVEFRIGVRLHSGARSGITEARNGDRVMFGFDGVRDAVASAPSGGALQTLLMSQQRFTGPIEQEDDITLIALNRLLS